jgi:hypothetical protein
MLPYTSRRRGGRHPLPAARIDRSGREMQDVDDDEDEEQHAAPLIVREASVATCGSRCW